MNNIRKVLHKCMGLFGLYFTRNQGKVDHVALFVVREFERLPEEPNDPDIEEIGYFAPDALPESTSPATRRRIQEFFEDKRGIMGW